MDVGTKQCEYRRCARLLTRAQILRARRKGGRARYCSNTCVGADRFGKDNPNWKGGKAEAICEICNCFFLADRCEIEKGWGFLCSTLCRKVWQSQNLAGENASRWAGGKVDRVCEFCGGPFGEWPSRIARGQGRFCCTRCSDLWGSENSVGEHNSNWRGGLSFVPYSSDFNEAFKTKIRERDNYICRLCGVPARAVHHINYDKEETTPENCITLCGSCHGTTGSNRDYWQGMLNKIMRVVCQLD